MKRVFLIYCLLTICIGTAIGQATNHWIDFNQTYFKIPVAKDGMYQLSYSALQDAGFPVGGDPSFIQLFHRGKEQAISVEGGDDGQFNPTDFIRFYGQKNDGTLDTALYRNSSDQPHRYHNLYSDTTYYFLTMGSVSGKRMVHFDELNTGGLQPQTYHLDEKFMVFAEQYAPGETYNNEIFSTNFGLGEGWTGGQFANGQSKDVQITGIENTFTTGPSPRLEILLVGINNVAHGAEIYVGPSQRLLKAVSFTGLDTQLILENLDWSDLTSDGKLNLQVRALNTGVPHIMSICYVRLHYPQSFDSQNAPQKIFHTVALGETKGYLEISNAGAAATLFDITDNSNVKIIGASLTATLNAVFPSADTERKLFLSTSDLIPAPIVPVNFRSIVPANHDYIIISHPRLRRPGGTYADPVKAYAEYRASEAGGSYDTLLVNIQEVYDQFNYGEKSSLAIYRFLEFLSKPTPPKYFFIIGKGLELWLNFNRNPGASTWNYKDLIPPAGFPGSDIAYSIPLNSTDNKPTISTGRLAVMFPAQVAAYLDKIKEKEQLPVNDLWQKKILHLSGGIEEGEPEYFRMLLEDYQRIAEGPYFGGQVSAIAKRSRDLEVVNIAEQVNNGLSLVTFFGHSSTSTLDFDIGYVTDPALNYHNKGKYPMLLMNGCEVGAFFLQDTLFGESWVYAKDRGAAAFIAHNSYGLVGALNVYSEQFYKVAFADSLFFGTGIGDIQKETSRRILDNHSPSIITLSQTQQMILLGDPAVKLFGTNKPDLEIKESQLSVLPYNGSKVTALTDSFAIKIVLRNYGMAKQDTFRMQVERVLPDNTVITYDSLLRIPYNTDTIYFVIRKGKELGAGNNTFKISVDADNIIAEVNEENNYGEYVLLIPSNGTKNLYPSDFAIVAANDVRLSFQATDLYSGERDFLLQIDTLHTFDSPFQKEFRVKGNVLASQMIELVDEDTLAYYWRTRLADPKPGENESWEVSSFTFIRNGEEGWAQVHFPQLINDHTAGLVKNESLRRIEFEHSITPIEITTYGANAGKPREAVSFKIKGQEYNLYSMVGGAWGCQNNTINLIAFDRRSTSPYIGVFLKWYELGGRRLSCGREPFVINSFMHSDIFNGGNKDIVQYVNNISEGDSVVLFTIGDPNVALWPSEAKSKLGELGISTVQLDGIVAGEPFVIFAKKGTEPGTAVVIRSEASTPAEAELMVKRTITGGYDAGTLSSPLIGPAKEWKSLAWKTTEVESQDNVNFQVSGVKFNGVEETLIESVTSTSDLSAIDAETYPYLKIKYFSADPTLLTSAQLNKWIVQFTPVPEGILLPDNEYTTTQLQEGQWWEQPFRFVNISDKTFNDSLSVSLNVFNHDKSETSAINMKIKSPLPSDTTRFTVRHNSKGFQGLNDGQIFVNPRIEAEQHYDNNVLQMYSYLNVLTDNIAPVLDVTIDGKHIVNGDFVSNNPEIRIDLWDENSLLLKSDTTGMELFITYPCQTAPCPRKKIWMKDESVKWNAATASENFNIRFSPKNLPPGDYTLSAAGQDVSGNLTEPFEIDFAVSETRTIEVVPLYPNPFFLDANYGFVLTAGAVPSSLGLKVLDLAGKPLYETDIRQEQLSVGQNLFYWDGHDRNGNALKSGLYLYLITITDEGQKIIHTGKILITR